MPSGLYWRSSSDKIYPETNEEEQAAPHTEQMPYRVVVGDSLVCIENDAQRIGDAPGEYPRHQSVGKVRDDVIPEEYQHPAHRQIEYDVQRSQSAPEYQGERHSRQRHQPDEPCNRDRLR